VLRLRNYLAGIGAWNKEREEALLQECAERVQQAVEDYLAIAPPDAAAMFDHLYAELPAALRDQRAAALRFASGGADSHG
jgi:pyruvate dehydrogenase E1 component alpha subunit